MRHHDLEHKNTRVEDDGEEGNGQTFSSQENGKGRQRVLGSACEGNAFVADAHPTGGLTGRPIFHGQALARDLWLERYGGWIVLGFTGCFTFFLLALMSTGHIPGQSFPLKSGSDMLQLVGEVIGFLFCLRIVFRLWKNCRDLQYACEQQKAENCLPGDFSTLQAEVQAARRAWLAWGSITLGIALYACGQAIWTSYDVRMPSSSVPFPGFYDVGFVASYPFFFIGTLLLTQRRKVVLGQARLLLDALAVFYAAFALSWFFVLGPAIAEVSGNFGAAFLSIYFPAGDLFLVAISAFLMFSPLSTRHQYSVFLRLCSGLFVLAVTDSLLGYFSFSPSGFNTGTLQDVLWPVSMLLIGLAAIEYPRSIAREQMLAVGSSNPALVGALFPTSRRVVQVSSTLRTIAPFLLALLTSAVLLTAVASRGRHMLLKADLTALGLIVLVVVRQALTLIENNQLTMQLHGELMLSQNELQAKRQEALTDAITGLPNHRAVISRIDEEVSRCQRKQSSCAVLFLDLDHFKRINDTWGHRAGDAILHEIGKRLRSTLRQADFVGRYGGEEFALVLVDADQDQGYQTAERIRAAVADQPCMWVVEETQSVIPIAVTTSIGIAIYQLHGESREALIEAADQAMYQAKHSGRNRACFPSALQKPEQKQDEREIAPLTLV